MSHFDLLCPNCQQVVRCAEQYRGRQVACSGCHEGITGVACYAAAPDQMRTLLLNAIAANPTYSLVQSDAASRIGARKVGTPGIGCKPGEYQCSRVALCCLGSR